jgi:hypothetical protein
MGMCQDSEEVFADELLERRAASRIPFRLPLRATIYAPPGCKGDTARICHLLAQDLSKVGVSLIYARPFQLGQRIEIEMPDRDRQAVVCRVTSMSDGRYLAGCKFED